MLLPEIPPVSKRLRHTTQRPLTKQHARITKNKPVLLYAIPTSLSYQLMQSISEIRTYTLLSIYNGRRSIRKQK